ncbi:MAG: hypothetical protein PHT40_02670 [Patescibacteria group bacterium]|nr:hypothetical protein [Patescibacteria group bacterium]
MVLPKIYLYGLVISGILIFVGGWQIYLTENRKMAFGTKKWFKGVVFFSSALSPLIVFLNSKFRKNKKYLSKTHEPLI